ncbi:alpha/beta-hydrolase [Violaceomyces palustris]|uniref:Alpha/beta-hydrolase n=1 Tax=Violaceomyces palustris TaxID=1673888 RepID=A0ACD0NM96_9BASI|nr:alpha/beta-hydrolase [Violaceomyces palustris]
MEPIIHVQGDPKSHLPPLFLIHPISGCMFPYVGLGKLSEDDRPVYGVNSYFFQPSTSQGPPESFDDVAWRYIKLIEDSGLKRPQQDWLLGGWSLGGMIAFRMSCLLTSQRYERVLECIMVDSPCPIGYPGFESQEQVFQSMRPFIESVALRSKNLAGMAEIDLRRHFKDPKFEKFGGRMRSMAMEGGAARRKRLSLHGMIRLDPGRKEDRRKSDILVRMERRSSFSSSEESSPSNSEPNSDQEELGEEGESDRDDDDDDDDDDQGEERFLSEQMDKMKIKKKKGEREDEWVSDPIKRGWRGILESIYHFLQLLSHDQESWLTASPPGQPYRGKVTLIKCNQPVDLLARTDSVRDRFMRERFEDDALGWRELGLEGIKVLHYASKINHNQCFDSDFIQETTELIKAAVDLVDVPLYDLTYL